MKTSFMSQEFIFSRSFSIQSPNFAEILSVFTATT